MLNNILNALWLLAKACGWFIAALICFHTVDIGFAILLAFAGIYTMFAKKDEQH